MSSMRCINNVQINIILAYKYLPWEAIFECNWCLLCWMKCEQTEPLGASHYKIYKRECLSKKLIVVELVRLTEKYDNYIVK